MMAVSGRCEESHQRNFFCVQCETAVCLNCLNTTHSGHKPTAKLSDAFTDRKRALKHFRDETKRAFDEANAKQHAAIGNLQNELEASVETRRREIEERKNELISEIENAASNLLTFVSEFKDDRMTIIKRKQEELEQQQRLMEMETTKANQLLDGADKEQLAHEYPVACRALANVESLPTVALSDQLDINFIPSKRLTLTIADFGHLNISANLIIPVMGYTLLTKLRVTKVIHYDINVIEPTTKSHCFVAYSDTVSWHSKDGKTKSTYEGLDAVTDMATNISGDVVVAMKNNVCLKLCKRFRLEADYGVEGSDVWYDKPKHFLHATEVIGSVAFNSRNELIIFDREAPKMRFYNDDGSKMFERNLQMVMNKVRSTGMHTLFAANVQDHQVTIEAVDGDRDCVVVLRMQDMEASQVCHSNSGYFLVLSFKNRQLHRFTEDGHFLDRHVLGQPGLFSCDRKLTFRITTFAVDNEEDILVGDKHGNVKIYAPKRSY